MIDDPLLPELHALATRLEPSGIRLIIGGGYGLVLRARQLQASQVRTLRPSLLAQRGTEDIDCFLSAEIITNGAKTETIRRALDSLGYRPVKEHVQFARTIAIGGLSRSVKFDFLAGPIPPEHKGMVRAKTDRIRPLTFNELHAYPTPEAFSLERSLQLVNVSVAHSAVAVCLPHPFTYLVLKLFALRDRLGSGQQTRQRYHALDLLALWASLTESEWPEVVNLAVEYEGHAQLQEAQHLVRQLFGHSSAPGVSALAAQATFVRDGLTEQILDDFRRDLHALLRA